MKYNPILQLFVLIGNPFPVVINTVYCDVYVRMVGMVVTGNDVLRILIFHFLKALTGNADH